MKPSLKNKEELRKILADYEISEHGRKVHSEMELVLLVGPTGAGRNSIINELMKTDKYHLIISDTTRPPRVNDGNLEQNGQVYWFRTEEEITADLEAGEFLEAVLIHEQQVSGISIRELSAAQSEGKIGINEVEIEGGKNILGVKPDCFVFFVIPPSFAEWMKRLEGRGEMHRDELSNRLRSALKEMAWARDTPAARVIINDNLIDAAEVIDKQVRHSAVDLSDHLEHIDELNELIARTEVKLAELEM